MKGGVLGLRNDVASCIIRYTILDLIVSEFDGYVDREVSKENEYTGWLLTLLFFYLYLLIYPFLFDPYEK